MGKRIKLYCNKCPAHSWKRPHGLNHLCADYQQTHEAVPILLFVLSIVWLALEIAILISMSRLLSSHSMHMHWVNPKSIASESRALGDPGRRKTDHIDQGAHAGLQRM
jgi:hypothetical protein